MNERPNLNQITPEIRRLLDAYLDGPIDNPDAARIEELAKANPAVAAELEAQRSMLAALRAPSGRIDMTEAVLSKINIDSPFVEIGRRHRRARRRTAVCVSVVLAVGGVALLQSMYPELSDFGTGERPISTLTEASRRDAVDGAQAVASAVGTITRTLVEPATPENSRRYSPRRAMLQLGDTSRYEPSNSWQLASASISHGDLRPISWTPPSSELISGAWQAPSMLMTRGGDRPGIEIAWVSGWRQGVSGIPSRGYAGAPWGR